MELKHKVTNQVVYNYNVLEATINLLYVAHYSHIFRVEVWGKAFKLYWNAVIFR